MRNAPRVESQRIGGVTEIAVLVAVKRGLIPGESRSYEERLRGAIANIAQRHAQRIPVELDRVSTIHFGRMIVLRPEQLQSALPEAQRLGLDDLVPLSFDEFVEIEDHQTIDPPVPTAQSDGLPTTMLLTLVEFDGELKPYFREIAQFIAGDFDSIFQNCQNFPGTADFELFWRWIRTYQITTDLFYATYPDISVVRIRQLELFKRRFDDFVARVRSPDGSRRGSMDELFDDFLRAEQQQAVGFPYASGVYRGADEPEGQ
jgi:hypothetical protein